MEWRLRIERGKPPKRWNDDLVKGRENAVDPDGVGPVCLASECVVCLFVLPLNVLLD